MNKTINRRHDGSDSEEAINAPSNRGNKLKRKAIFVHEGQADLPSGPKTYREEIEHAGYKRYILSRNPPRLDEDGDELEDDEIDEEADAAAKAENVYGEIRVEEVLAPLTSAADLPNHPSLSFPFLSKTLPELAKQASDMVHREKASLWKAKQLLMKFRGDEDWAPCGMMETDNDIALFGPIGFETLSVEPRSQRVMSAVGGSEGLGHRPKNVKHSSGDGASDQSPAALDKDGREIRVYENGPEDGTMVDAPCGGAATHKGRATNPDGPRDGVMNDSRDIASEQNPDSNVPNAGTTGLGIDIGHPDGNGEPAQRSKIPAADSTPRDQTPAAELDVEAEEESSQPPLHRMTTRAQALATASNTPPRSRSISPTPNSPPTWVHPFFLVPESAVPDWNFGLPPAEAADTRRLLLLYVQKQEEVCRGAEQLRDGLLKANRKRKEVWKWAKAEAHVAEMSDGEDWYDKSEWGLEEDLKKGKEEEDDDGGKEGKKTRGRRA
ncbi:hypothetical protein FGG08_000938 [Glutinoglossum americanum]|uniref:Transcriptional regulatory protein RXT2 N-terminal domain-containing protein n=1 Tax=Glutinoglossum americanum TaxID=1670608 RepID=A0A9P8I9D1_9PEZI|nr:hypothetical protein FGG08_000938 [Glutinoglossum americanum]